MEIPEIKDYKCPECNSKMERGFVSTNHSFRWASDKNTGSFFAINAETLTPNSIWKLKNPKCSALRCRTCDLVLFKNWN